MAAPAHFSHVMLPDMSAKFERNFMRAKLEILYFLKFLGNYKLGNFLETICLETICWESFWKLYAGNLLMETMCWEIRG